MSNRVRPDRPSACIHIGLSKAASTTLQWYLFGKHSELEYLGKGQGDRYRTPAIARIIKKVPRRQTERTLDQWSRWVAELAQPALDRGRVLLASREGLAHGGYERQKRLAKNIERVFGPSKIILVVRHPIRFVESTYLQLLRGHNIRRAHKRYRPAGYFTVDDWLTQQWDRPTKGDLRVLQSQQILEPHLAAFGRENVGVFLFEQLQKDPAAFISAVCDFIGIDPAEGVRLAAGEHAHPRISTDDVERLKEVYRSPWRRLQFRWGSPGKRRKMLGITRKRNLTKAQLASVELPTVWKSRIEDFVREDCRYLRGKWGLPVDEAGYPL